VERTGLLVSTQLTDETTAVAEILAGQGGAR
jgi:hypothetical protein